MKGIFDRFVLVFVILVLMIGCATMKSRWQKTRLRDTVEAYEQFLDKYPNSDFSDAAHARLLQFAIEANTIEAYEQFLAHDYPCEFSDEARARLVLLQIQRTRNDNTLEAYEEFCEWLNDESYPLRSSVKNGDRPIEIKVKKRIEELNEEFGEELAWHKAKQSNIFETYALFSLYYPNSAHLSEIRALLKELVDVYIIEELPGILWFENVKAEFDNLLPVSSSGSITRRITPTESFETYERGKEEIIILPPGTRMTYGSGAVLRIYCSWFVFFNREYPDEDKMGLSYKSGTGFIVEEAPSGKKKIYLFGNFPDIF